MGTDWLKPGVLGVVSAATLAIGGCGGSDDAPERGSTTTGGAQAQVAEPGEPPTRPPHPVLGHEFRPPDPVVLVSGETARGDGFEFVLYGSAEGTCLVTSFPQRRGAEGGGGCGDGILPSIRPGSPIQAAGSGAIGEESELYGFLDAGVDSVELSYGEGQTQQAPASQIPDGLVRRAGGKPPLGVFVAFPPAGVDPDDVTATAYDDAGRELGTAAWPDFE